MLELSKIIISCDFSNNTFQLHVRPYVQIWVSRQAIMNLIIVAVFEFWKSPERFRMAAYEDWIPLDNDIFNRLDNCDPSFCWELMKNDVIKVRFYFFDFDNLLTSATFTEFKLIDSELIGWGADSCSIFRRSLQLGTVLSCIKTSRRHEIGWDISRLFRNGFILLDHPFFNWTSMVRTIYVEHK